MSRREVLEGGKSRLLSGSSIPDLTIDENSTNAIANKAVAEALKDIKPSDPYMTKEAFKAALAAGEIPDGTKVDIIDDSVEGITSLQISHTTSSGVETSVKEELDTMNNVLSDIEESVTDETTGKVFKTVYKADTDEYGIYDKDGNFRPFKSGSGVSFTNSVISSELLNEGDELAENTLYIEYYNEDIDTETVYYKNGDITIKRIYAFSDKTNFGDTSKWIRHMYIGDKTNKAVEIYIAPYTDEELTIDPTVMEMDEAYFLDIINAGLQDQMSIGATITGVTDGGTCGTYRVIDVNHDGTNNTVDIISTTQVGSMAFGSNQIYANSNVRAWLNDTYMNSFSTNMKAAMKTMAVSTNGTTVNDKIKAPSMTEFGSDSAQTVEGNKYPNYNGSSLWIPAGSKGISIGYWLRSRRTNHSVNMWYVNSDGTISNNSYSYDRGVVAILRF